MSTEISFAKLHQIKQKALEQIRFINEDEVWQEGLQGLYLQGILFCLSGNFPFDPKIILRSNLQNFRDYFQYVLRGAEYAQITWGQNAVPQAFEVNLALNHPTLGLISRYIGYNQTKDEFAVTVPHIFEEINGYEGRALSSDIHLPANVVIKPEDHTTLQTIEEFYHRYQVHELGKNLQAIEEVLSNPGYHTTDRNEREIASIWEQAINDLHIRTFRLNV